MKKLEIKKILVGGMALSAFSLAAVSPVFASGASSIADVTLEAQEDESKPSIVDPDNENGGETENTGLLTIDYVSSLSFGLNDLSSTAQTYTTNTDRPHVQVTDVRGSGQGWTLQVSATAFTEEVDEETTRELKGAAITLPGGEIQTTLGNPSTNPNTYEVELNTTAQTIMDAEVDAGMGTWASKFNTDGVELYVPAGNYAGDYTAELTWTLSNAPQ